MDDLIQEQSIQEPEAKKGLPGWLNFVIEVVQTLLLAVVLYFAIDLFVARVRVENISMQPSLNPGEFLIVNKLAYRTGEFHTGDIVVFHHTQQEDYIKRVIGVPGDTVEIKDNKVFVNGVELVEPYVAEPPAYNGLWTVPEGNIFVLGDNRNRSSDSSRWGFVPVNTVVGKALVVYWPLTEMKLLTQTPVVNAKDIPN